LPVRIVAFNTAEGWSLDVTDDIAAGLAQAHADRSEITLSIVDFIADHPSEQSISRHRQIAPQHQYDENNCI